MSEIQEKPKEQDTGKFTFTSMMVGGILIAGYFVMKTNGNASIPINNLADGFFIIGSLLLFGAGMYLLGKPFFQKTVS